MLEPHLLSPVLYVVALITLFSLLTFMSIVGFVAGETGFLHFDFFLHRLRMASEAGQLVMRPFQGKLSLFVVVKFP
jgi:hypothetical protein